MFINLILSFFPYGVLDEQKNETLLVMSGADVLVTLVFMLLVML